MAIPKIVTIQLNLGKSYGDTIEDITDLKYTEVLDYFNDFRRDIIFELLFTFSGEITIHDLANRLYIYLLPDYADDGYTGEVFPSGNPFTNRVGVVRDIENDLLNLLDTPETPPTSETKVDSDDAKDLIQNLIG